MFNTKWVIFNSLTIFITVFLIQYYDIINTILFLDKTYVSFLTIGIYLAATGYLGYMGERANFEAVNFYGSRLTGIGLAGTIGAIMLMLFGVQDLAQFRQNILHEVAPVFITALFGIGLSTLLSLQVGICFGRYDSE